MKAAVVAVCVAIFAAGCGSSSPVAATTTAPTLTTELFTGNLPVAGSSFYSFTVANAGSVSITLGSLTLGRFSPLAIDVGLGLGVPAGTGCELTSSLNAVPALTAQLMASLGTGTYCVNISDIGKLSAPVAFTIRIVHP